MINYAFAETPKPGERWRRMSNDERLAAVNRPNVNVKEAHADGRVIVSLLYSVSAAIRGPLLLDYEDEIKEMVDPSLTVWLEPMGDKNSLRKLRGIEVKSL